MLDRLFFNKITPYDRSFIHVKTENKVFMLPAINTGVFFLTNGDTITIDDLKALEQLPYLDYQFLSSDKTLLLEMEEFTQYIKKELYENDFADFQVVNKQIIGRNVYIILQKIKLDRMQNSLKT